MFVLNHIANFVLLISLLSYMFVSEFMPGRSSYSFKTGILDCNNLEFLKGCRHEIGHKMDGDLGMPSQSVEFQIAVKTYLLVEMRPANMPSDLAMLIHFYPDKNPVELYAGIYAYVEGDISKLPSLIAKFYSNDPSYMDLYDCLSQTGLNICGRSISFLKG